MSPNGGAAPGRRYGALAGGTAMAACLVTLAVIYVPFIGFAYRAPALHVALETADALIALLVAYLAYGRFRVDRELRELFLVLALCTVAAANLVLTALPNAVARAQGEDVTGWAGLVIRFSGALLLLAAALTRPGSRTTPGRARALCVGLTLGLTALAVAAMAFDTRLPSTVVASPPIGDTTHVVLEAQPVVLAVQGLGALIYGVAAVAFTRRGRAGGDELLRWLGAGCVLGAAARVHYVLFPSLYSQYVYTGDVLRLLSYVFMLVGATREIRTYWELRTRAAVLEDRRRMARELHDGLSQELAFISAQSKRLVGHPGDVTVADHIAAAALRAEFEARRAVRAMSRAPDVPFVTALQQVIDDLSQRYEIKAVTSLAPEARLPQAQGEVVFRIVGEALRNAVRHGRADRVEVVLTAAPLRLSITDDGRGFRAGSPVAPRIGGFGITSMRERAAGLGARLTIRSEPGHGTTVQVEWP